MKIIGAGLSKTGTKSLAYALRYLGYTVHDLHEQQAYYDEYIPALESGITPDFAAMYANVDAVTDIPACVFFVEIYRAFPDAKVLLSVRDNEEVWFESLQQTRLALQSVFKTKAMFILGALITPSGRKRIRLLDALNFMQMTKETYLKHNARVQEVIPRDKLLVFNVKQGWKPLCEFLGVEVPDVPFPRVNVKSKSIADMVSQAPITKKMYNELIFIQIVAVIALGIFVLYFLW